MASESRPPNKGQLAPKLPGLTTYITGHKSSNGTTTIQERRPAVWQSLDNNNLAFNVAYTTSEFPASLNKDEDLVKHDEVLSSGRLGLVRPNGTVLRFVDFAPESESTMHRTRSLDYGIVLDGAIELILDSGETQSLYRGDCAIQRGTNHAWRNPQKTEWTRMVFILQDCQPLEIGGQVLKEDLGRSAGDILPSGND